MIGTSISHQVMMKNVQYIQENSLALRENSLHRRNHPNLLTPLLDPIFRKRIVRLCMGSYLPRPGVKITPFLKILSRPWKTAQTPAFNRRNFWVLHWFVWNFSKTEKPFWLDCVAPIHNRWTKTSDLDVLDYLQTCGKTDFFFIEWKFVFFSIMCCRYLQNLCLGCFLLVGRHYLPNSNV